MPDPPEDSPLGSEFLRGRAFRERLRRFQADNPLPPETRSRYIEQPSRRRFAYVLLVTVIAGALLGVTHAPFWAGFVVLVPIVMFGVPYVTLHKLPPEPPPVRKLPVLRKPTWWERLVFAFTRLWPDSYAEARLAHIDAVDAAVRAMPYHEAARALVDEAPYGRD